MHVRRKMAATKIDLLLVTHLPNIRYLTGFSGSNALLMIDENRSRLVTDVRYEEQVRLETVSSSIVIARNRSLMEEALNRAVFRHAKSIGFESAHLTHMQFRMIDGKKRGKRIIGCTEYIEEFREVKSVEELDCIREAVRISDHVFDDLLGLIRPGLSEADIAAEISYRHRRYGAQGDAFEPIVLAGRRTSLIHGRSSTCKIKNGDIVLLDFGSSFGGYCSDMTRTISVGSINRKMKMLHAAVRNAQKRAIEIAHSGIPAKGVDAAARKSIAGAGYGSFFKHSVGHGLGLEVHESPVVSRKSDRLLRTGNVITIEPGVYLPGEGGVRIEDDVLILEGSCLVLNQASRDWIVV